jgi:hypothetical protein
MSTYNVSVTSVRVKDKACTCNNLRTLPGIDGIAEMLDDERNGDVSTTTMIRVLRLVAGFLSSVPMDVATIIILMM